MNKADINHPVVQLFLVIELARAAIDNNMELHKEILELIRDDNT
jgi:hypothetical protein